MTEERVGIRGRFVRRKPTKVWTPFRPMGKSEETRSVALDNFLSLAGLGLAG